MEWGVDQAPGGYEALHKFAVMQRELFLKLPPMARAPQALRRLSKAGVRIRIITHRLFIKYFHQIAVSQTIQWLDRHDIPYWDLCFMQQKTAVGADLYIEDSPANIERLRAEGAEDDRLHELDERAPARPAGQHLGRSAGAGAGRKARRGNSRSAQLP